MCLYCLVRFQQSFLVNLIDFMNSRMLSIPIKNECMNLYFDTVS